MPAPAVPRARRRRRRAPAGPPRGPAVPSGDHPVLDDVLISRALRFSLKAHAGARRKGTDLPFIVHPLGVTVTTLSLGGDSGMAAAALLHDVLEDTDTGLAELRRAFGPRLARLVAALSDDMRQSWEERKRRTLRKLTSAPRDVLLIAFADKLDNIRAIAWDFRRLKDRVWTRFNRPKSEQQWYYRGLARIFQRRFVAERRPWSREFSRLVAEVFGGRGGAR